MKSIFTPANIVVALVVAVCLYFGFKRIAGMSHGKSCCSDGDTRKKVKRVEVADTDPSHYPYSDELLIGGMSCEGCVRNVANALNAVEGTWATVTLDDHTALVRSKAPVDRVALEAAVKDAGYYVMKL